MFEFDARPLLPYIPPAALLLAALLCYCCRSPRR